MGNPIYHSQYSAQQMESAMGKTPVVRNGTWWIWDIVSMDYVDTTSPALAWVGTQEQYNALTTKDPRQVYCITEPVDSILIYTYPTKMTYISGETLDLTGLVVLARYPSGAQLDVTNRCLTNPAEGDTLTTVGTIPVAVTFSEDGVTKTAYINITVEEAT